MKLLRTQGKLIEKLQKQFLDQLVKVSAFLGHKILKRGVKGCIMYICSSCNVELTKDDLDACEVVSIGKLFEDCLLNKEREIFVDDKGLNSHQDKYERFVIDRWKKHNER